MWWAIGHVITAPVDVLMQASQHHTPRMVPWKFGPCTHQQCAIVDCPRKAVKMASIIHIQQGQGIGHAGLLQPVPSISAPLHGEAEDLICNYDLFIDPPLLLDLVIDIKKFIQCKEEHLWPIAISHQILMMQ